MRKGEGEEAVSMIWISAFQHFSVSAIVFKIKPDIHRPSRVREGAH